MTITVSTDGSALGNPNGPMGWAWADHAANAARTEGHQHDGDSDAGGATNGTNQIGELCAVLEALRAHRGSEPLTIETDSQYAINCSTTWVRGWKRNGWKNSQKKPVKNAPLIKAIDAEISRREGPVRFVWVKGHNGNPGNEKVDDLAHTYSGDARSGVKSGYLPSEGWQSLLTSPYARGVDVPADARMLLDGKITEEQYHLGRGADSDDGDDDASSQAWQHGARMPLMERLSERESVPEYHFDKRDDADATDDEASLSDGLNTEEHDDASSEPASVSDHNQKDAAGPDEWSGDKPDDDSGTEADDADTAMGSGLDGTGTDGMDADADTDDTDADVADADANRNIDETNLSESTDDRADGLDESPDESEDAVVHKNLAVNATSEEHADGDIRTDNTNLDDGRDYIGEFDDASVPENPMKTDSGTNGRSSDGATRQENNGMQRSMRPKYVNNGLTVSGTLRFSPAPSTSPTFNGSPRHIRGVIPIEGDVAGDGTLNLGGAPFLIANAKQD